MSTELLLVFAIVVFGLMLTGLYLTASEFLRVSEDPSTRKGVDVNSPDGAAPAQSPEG